MIQITSITRGYLNEGDRKRAIAALRRQGYDHFVEYMDTASKFALCYGKYLDGKGKPAAKGQLSLNLESVHHAERPNDGIQSA